MAEAWQPVTAAVVREANGPFHLEELTLELPRETEVLVKIVACGICHTDLWSRGDSSQTKPIVYGHEGAGVVVRVGSAVQKVKPGDHVAMSFHSCGICENCGHGKPGYCYKHFVTNFGGKRIQDDSTTYRTNEGETVHGCYFRQSSFGTYALCTERNCVKVPQDYDLRIAGPLGCGVQTGAGAVLNTLNCSAGSRIAVFGVGGVGLSAIMAARVSGCTTIIAVDLHEDRLKLALDLGATHTLSGKDPELKEKLIQLSGGGLEYAIDTTGNPIVLRTAFEALRSAGIVGLIGGAAPGAAVQVDLGHLLHGRQVRGIIQGDSVSDVFLPRLMELYKQGWFPYDKMIKFYDFKDINQAASDAHSGKTIKPVLIMDPSYSFASCSGATMQQRHVYIFCIFGIAAGLVCMLVGLSIGSSATTHYTIEHNRLAHWSITECLVVNKFMKVPANRLTSRYLVGWTVSYIFEEITLTNITERFTRQSDAQEAADMFPVNSTNSCFVNPSNQFEATFQVPAPGDWTALMATGWALGIFGVVMMVACIVYAGKLRERLIEELVAYEMSQRRIKASLTGGA